MIEHQKTERFIVLTKLFLVCPYNKTRNIWRPLWCGTKHFSPSVLFIASNRQKLMECAYALSVGSYNVLSLREQSMLHNNPELFITQYVWHTVPWQLQKSSPWLQTMFMTMSRQKGLFPAGKEAVSPVRWLMAAQRFQEKLRLSWYYCFSST